MCCSVRDKQEGVSHVSMAAAAPHFKCSEVTLPLDLRTKLLVFAPLWPGGHAATAVRRMALAGDGGVYVFRMGGGPCDQQQLKLEHALRLEDGQSATALLFKDEDSSRHLIVALAPRPGAPPSTPRGPKLGHVVRVWSCGVEGPEPDGVEEWRLDEGYMASLEEHAAPVTRMAVSSTYLLTADALGHCHVWQKTRGFAARAEARLHQGGLTDLAVDRLFAYTVGAQDMSVRVWSVPDLKPVLVIAADTVEAQLPPAGFGAAFPVGMAPRSLRLAELTAVRRPVSRWSGSQGSTRNATTPKGIMFVAGSLADGQEVAGAGAGVLMEWSLGPKPACQGVQVAHDSPIISLAYGPYDNGPLITADARGVFRVWDYTPRLWCSQQVDSGGCLGSHNLAVAMDPLNRTVYSIVGDSRLFVWRQHGEITQGLGDR